MDLQYPKHGLWQCTLLPHHAARGRQLHVTRQRYRSHGLWQLLSLDELYYTVHTLYFTRTIASSCASHSFAPSGRSVPDALHSGAADEPSCCPGIEAAEAAGMTVDRCAGPAGADPAPAALVAPVLRAAWVLGPDPAELEAFFPAPVCVVPTAASVAAPTEPTCTPAAAAAPLLAVPASAALSASSAAPAACIAAESARSASVAAECACSASIAAECARSASIAAESDRSISMAEHSCAMSSAESGGAAKPGRFARASGSRRTYQTGGVHLMCGGCGAQAWCMRSERQQAAPARQVACISCVKSVERKHGG